MLSPDEIRGPRADDPKPVKYTMSATARRLLRTAAHRRGLDMSTVLDLLIREHLTDVAAASAVEGGFETGNRKQEDERKREDEFRFDA